MRCVRARALIPETKLFHEFLGWIERRTPFGRERRLPLTEDASPSVPTEGAGSSRLALLLAAAMFVLVVDTSLMNVSISAVVEDLDTTVSGVQAAIALEALVSAAFILISSKVGDLIGRKRAYVLGLLAYAIGALAMTLAQSLTAIIVFWAIIGGLGRVAAAARDAVADPRELRGSGAKEGVRAGRGVGRDRGRGRTAARWLRHHVPLVACRLRGSRSSSSRSCCPRSSSFATSRTPGRGRSTWSARSSPSSGWAASSSGILVWQEGGEFVGLLMAIGAAALALLACWLVRRKRQGKLTLLDPDLFRFPHFTIGISQQMLQNITLGGAMIALPIFLQMTLEYDAMQAGLSLAPLSLSMFGVAMLAGRKAGGRRPSNIVLVGFALSTVGMALIIPIVPRTDSGWALVIPLLITGSGLGLLVSQLNNYTLSPIEEERVSEAAGVNSAAGSFGLSFGLAMAGGIMLAFLAFEFTHLTEAEHGDPTGAAAADREHPRGRRRGDEQLAARTAARRRARRRPGRDPPHQRGSAESLPPDRAACPAAR